MYGYIFASKSRRVQTLYYSSATTLTTVPAAATADIRCKQCRCLRVSQDNTLLNHKLWGILRMRQLSTTKERRGDTSGGEQWQIILERVVEKQLWSNRVSRCVECCMTEGWGKYIISIFSTSASGVVLIKFIYKFIPVSDVTHLHVFRSCYNFVIFLL